MEALKNKNIMPSNTTDDLPLHSAVLQFCNCLTNEHREDISEKGVHFLFIFFLFLAPLTANVVKI